MGRDGRPLPWASGACWPGCGGQRGHAGTWVGGSRAPAPPPGDLSEGPLPGWPHCPSLEWRHCWAASHSGLASEEAGRGRAHLGIWWSGGVRQARWKARGQPSQQRSSPPSLHAAHSSSFFWHR